jgi:hypothetical protein
MSADNLARKRAPDSLIRRAHPGPVLVAVPGDGMRLPAVRSTEQARAQLPQPGQVPALDRPPANL